MKRLTARIDNGLGDYDEICFINPNDPEGAYSLDDIVRHGSYETKLAIAERLAAYEDTGLTPEQVQELKEKQIPKPPEYEYIPQYKYASPTAICPICKGIVESPLMNDDYCRDCGQAIDWE